MYTDNKDLAKRTVSYKVLKGQSCEIALRTKYEGYQTGLASMVFKFFELRSESDKQKSDIP